MTFPFWKPLKYDRLRDIPSVVCQTPLLTSCHNFLAEPSQTQQPHSFIVCKISDGFQSVVCCYPTYPFNLVLWPSFPSSTADNLIWNTLMFWQGSCNCNLVIFFFDIEALPVVFLFILYHYGQVSSDLSVIVHQRARRTVYSFVSVIVSGQLMYRSCMMLFCFCLLFFLGPNYLLSPTRSNVTGFHFKEIHYYVFGLY